AAVVGLEPRVGEPGVVGDATLRRDTELLENRPRRLEGESTGAAERPRDVLDDPPVFTRLTRTGDRFVDLDDAALGGRDDSLVLLVKRAREHDVGPTSGLVQEEVDGRVELELLERAAHERVVRKRDDGVGADRQEPANLSPVDLSEEPVRVDPGLRQVVRRYAPHAGDVCPVVRISQVARPRELVAFLAVLATALPVALARDGRIAAAPAADP